MQIVSVRLRRPNRCLCYALPLQTEPVCRPTHGTLKPLQTNLCRGLLTDITGSAFTGLDNWLPECRAQRARQLPFVREAAPLPSGLSLRMRGLRPKRRLSGARCVTRAHTDVLGHIGADIPGKRYPFL